MEEDLLARVISAEKEIQACLETERVKAGQWLEIQKQEAEAEFTEEEHRIRDEFRLSAERSRADALKEAGEIIRSAEQRAAGIRNAGDETLKEILMKKISLILTE